MTKKASVALPVADFATRWSYFIQVLLDPGASDYAPIAESDRLRVRCSAPSKNDAWQLNVAAAAPWNGNPPSVSTLGGKQVLDFNGSTSSIAGFLTRTPTGENFVIHSESTTGWTLYDGGSGLTGLLATPGPTPPAPYTTSTTLTENPAGYPYRLLYVTPGATTPYRAGVAYEFGCVVQAAQPSSWLYLSIDNWGFVYINLDTGATGGSAGTPLDGWHVDPVPSAPGWWHCWFRFTANVGGSANNPTIGLAGADGAVSGPPAGRAMHLTGVHLTPARSGSASPSAYKATAGAAAVQPTHSSCTIVAVIQDDYTDGEATWFDSSESLLTNAGPMLFRDATTRIARGFRQAGVADISYTPASQTAPAVLVAMVDANVARAAIYENGVIVLEHYVASAYAKPANFERIGRLLDNTYGSDGKQGLTAYAPLAVPAADAIDISAYAKGHYSVLPAIPEYSPKAVIGCTHDFDADELVALGNGNPAGSWECTTCNYASTGANALLASSSARPTLITNAIKGHAALDFDGVDDAMQGPNTTNYVREGDKRYWQLAVFQVRAINTNNATIYDNDCVTMDDGQYSGLFLKNVGGVYWCHAYQWDTGPKDVGIEIALNTPLVAFWRFTGSTLFFSINGSAEVSVAVTQLGSFGNMLVGKTPGTPRHFDGQITRLSRGTCLIGSTNRAKLIAWAMNRYVP